MKNMKPVMLVVLLMLMIVGCTNSDERLVEMAREHAARQAESQRQMADLQKQVAQGSRELVENDAKAREHLTSLQHDLRTDQAEIGHQRDQLENDRREIAAQRHRDPIVAAIIMDVGIVLACLLPLALGIYVLRAACRAGESDGAVVELLVQELVASEPRLSLPGRPSLPTIEHQTVVDSRPGGSRDANDRPD
jgi:K+-sensing histidine kinase KdpD